MLGVVDVHEFPEVDSAELRLLLDRVRRDLDRPLCVFDADGVLWTGDLGFDLFTAALARRALREDAREPLAAEARSVGISAEGSANELGERLLDAFAAGQYDDARALAMMAWAFAGFTQEEMDEFAADVVRREDVEGRLIGPVRDLVRWALAEKVEVVVCAAATRSVVSAGVQLLGLDASHVVAATPEVVGGALGPRLRRPGLPHGEGKVAALEHARKGRTILAAFGDRADDAHLLRLAHVPVAVGPSPHLLATAATIPALVVLRTG